MTANQDQGRDHFGRTDEEVSVAFVMRGLLHDLANLATALDGVTSALRHDGAPALARAQEDLHRATDRMFALHAQLRSLLPDHAKPEAIDPRAIATEVSALLSWHGLRSCAVTLEEGAVAPILGEPWQVRRQFLGACDSAAGDSGDLHFSFRVVGDTVSAVRDDGVVFWTSSTLAAARLRERDTD